MHEVKRIHGLPFSLGDINTLERELMDNIERLDGDPKELKRIARVVSNKMSYLRSVLTAERLLENDGVEVIRDGANWA